MAKHPSEYWSYTLPDSHLNRDRFNQFAQGVCFNGGYFRAENGKISVYVPVDSVGHHSVFKPYHEEEKHTGMAYLETPFLRCSVA